MWRCVETDLSERGRVVAGGEVLREDRGYKGAGRAFAFGAGYVDWTQTIEV